MDAEALITLLDLQPHPEGGWFRETFRSDQRVAGRSASTAIWYLLPAGGFSAWHRVNGADEVWHHYDGGPLTLWMLDGESPRRVVLGSDWAAGERPQAVVPAGTWQAAVAGDAFALCGCTVAPGFEFADFEMATRDGLRAAFPAHADLVDRFTR